MPARHGIDRRAQGPGQEAYQTRTVKATKRHRNIRTGAGAASELWVLGLCLGIDLLFNGFAWISYSFAVLSKGAGQRA